MTLTGNFKDTTMPLDYFLWLTVGLPWTFAALADPNKIKVEIVPGSGSGSSGRYRIVDKSKNLRRKKEERQQQQQRRQRQHQDFRNFIDRS
jgi:hypothetical protein